MRLSVIIPAYNCAATIGDTLESLMAQTMADLEIIIINDGSTDNTLEVLERYVRGDEHIRVISVENSGPASARNLGIREAEGDYLYFMDSDDLILPDMLRDMIQLAEKHDLDCVACGYTMENVSGSHTHSKVFGYEDFVAETPEEYRARLMDMIKAHLMYVVWNKIFRTSLIKENGILFGDFFSGEDRLFNTQTFPFIRRFGFLNKPYYRYFLRGQKTLANRYLDNRFESALACHTALIDAYRKMGLYDEQNRQYIDFVFVKGVMSCFTQLNAKGCPMKWKEKKAFIRETLQNSYVSAAIHSTDADVGYSKMVNRILCTGNAALIYLMAKAVYLLQFRLNSLYLNLKHGKS